MGKKLKILLITLCTLGLMVFFGGACVMDVITPAHISPIVADYTDANDVPLPPFKPLVPWWTSLFDLKVLEVRAGFIHQYRQMDEGLRYGLASGTNQFFIGASEEIQQAIFAPDGVVGLLLPTSLASILAVLAGGRFLKSPREKELEEKINGNNS